MQKKLTELQGYNAMAKLFQIYYDLDPSGDIGDILSSMAFLKDKSQWMAQCCKIGINF
jgi:hypothetical protein